MIIKKVLLAAILGLAFLGILAGSAVAQEEEEVLGTYGHVVKVTGNQLTISEWDIEKEAMVDVSYTVDAKTKLINVGALKDLKADQSVDINYVVRAGKNVAVDLTLEIPSDDEEEEEAPATE